MSDLTCQSGSPVDCCACAAGGPRLLIGIASTGRPESLSQTVAALAHQHRVPDHLVISVAEEGDVSGGFPAALPFPVEVLVGSRSLPRQRNRILARLAPGDVALILEDDVLLAADYLVALERAFAAHPEAALIAGRSVADGSGGRGLSREAGQAALERSRPAPDAPARPVYAGHGGAVAVRADAVLAHGVRFDESLPAAGWLGEVDFARQIAAHGAVLRADGLRSVRLGAREGRAAGVRLGYSQVAAPAYLIGKGTLSRQRACRMVGRTVAANLVHALRPRPWTDSRGRLRGNLIALSDLMRGQAAPDRIGEP